MWKRGSCNPLVRRYELDAWGVTPESIFLYDMVYVNIWYTLTPNQCLDQCKRVYQIANLILDLKADLLT
jgi:hypothetical protein